MCARWGKSVKLIEGKIGTLGSLRVILFFSSSLARAGPTNTRLLPLKYFIQDLFQKNVGGFFQFRDGLLGIFF
jgi:hypothetical protein